MTDPLPIATIQDRESAFAFVLGILFNQQMRASAAWQAPERLGQRIGGLTPENVVKIGLEELTAQFSEYPVIHPFIAKMPANIYQAATMVINDYDGDARNIWTPVVDAGTFINRLSAFPGIGGHKANIALFVATVQLGINVRKDGGDYSIHSCTALAQLFYPNHEPILIDA